VSSGGSGVYRDRAGRWLVLSALAAVLHLACEKPR
jgi:hypothetical protein